MHGVQILEQLRASYRFLRWYYLKIKGPCNRFCYRVN